MEIEQKWRDLCLRVECAYNYPCPNYDKCKEGMPTTYGHRFYKAKVGKAYFDQPIKVLFVGKEATDNCGDLSKTTISEPSQISNVPRDNYHYFSTIYTAAILIRGKTPNSPRKEDLLEFDDSSISQQFCLTNYFKCAFKTDERNHNIPTNKHMKEKCAQLLLNEIDVLQPHVIVIQGQFYGAPFWAGLRPFYIGDVYKSQICDISVTHHKKENNPFYVIWSYHPCAHGRKWFSTLNEFEQALHIVRERLS